MWQTRAETCRGRFRQRALAERVASDVDSPAEAPPPEVRVLAGLATSAAGGAKAAQCGPLP